MVFDFTRTQLHDFITSYLIQTAPTAPVADGEVVVNVRRGDYYSDPYVRGTHSFDIPAYLDQAFQQARAAEPIRSVVVVSDGSDWCQTKLDELIRRFVASVTYASAAESPQDNFRRVSTARRLIGTNSTFSYWAGYISNNLHGPDSHVVMPWFHARRPEGIGALQLDPGWTIVYDILGGWDS